MCQLKRGRESNAQSLLLPVGKLRLFAAIPKQRNDSAVAKDSLLLAAWTDIPEGKEEGEAAARWRPCSQAQHLNV